jgi:hypothetical protein
MSLSQLIQIAPPPIIPLETGSPKQWEVVQGRLGTPLPPDYKAFTDHYGIGQFNNFVVPYNPFTSNEYLNLFQALDVHHHANRQVQMKGRTTWSIVDPFELYPAPEGLLPWGTTTRFRFTFFWQLSGPSDTWSTILYDLQTGEYEVWKMPFTSFLVGLFSKEIESVLLSDDFFPKDQRAVFQPYQGDAFKDDADRGWMSP